MQNLVILHLLFMIHNYFNIVLELLFFFVLLQVIRIIYAYINGIHG